MTARSQTRASRVRLLASAARRHRRARAIERGSRPALVSYQQRRFAETVRHAAAASPLYRELYAGLDLGDALSPTDLPAVDKAMLMERFDAWVEDPRLSIEALERHLAQLDGDQLFLDEYRVMATGGTSGRRGIFIYDREEWSELLVSFLRWSELLGMRPRLGRRRRLAVVGAVSSLHMTVRLGMSIDVGLYRVRRLDARLPLTTLADELQRFDPDVLLGYPSVLAQLASEQVASRLRLRPQVVGTTSEVRTAEDVELVRAAWGQLPFDLYGTTEGVFGGDCARHAGMHLFEDTCFVEVVDEHNRPVGDGELGHHLLVTSFVKRVQPLIRYEVSDMAALATQPCGCGRCFARLVSVHGRSDDILHFDGPNGSVAIHPIALRSPLAAIVGLRQYRVVAYEDGLLIETVADSAASAAETGERVANAVRSVLDEHGLQRLTVKARPCREIERTSGPGAKLKLVERRREPLPR